MKRIPLLLLSLVALSVSVLAQNAKPFVIPELKSWTGGKGTYLVTPQTVLSAAPELHALSHDFCGQLESVLGTPLMMTDDAAIGGIRLELTTDDLLTDANEAYRILISPEGVRVEGGSVRSLRWGCQTVLQLLEQNRSLPCGTIVDEPEYAVRGFMLDVGRKFFDLDFIRSTLAMMSYYKMNVLHIHLNDNGFKQFYGDDWDKTYAAFRLESERYPGLTAKDGHYTKEEFRALQKEANERYGVTIVPEIDVPAHSLSFAHYMPELGSDKYGKDHLDLFNPKTYEVLDNLFDEYLSGDDPVFVNQYVHIGTDEYSNKDQKVVEQFRAFTDHYIRKVEEYGKRAAVWGSLTHARGETPVKVDDVLMYCWSKDYALTSEMINIGYDVIAIPDNWTYIVPAAGYYYDYLNIGALYNRWTPAVATANEVFEERHPQIKGGMFAVWNDHCGNGISAQDVFHRMYPATQTMATKMWAGKNTTIPFEVFDAKRKNISATPVGNLLGLPKGLLPGVIARVDSPKVGTLGLPMEDIGYNYRVSFDLKAGKNTKGTRLFSSRNSVVYLSDPESGRLGYERDGYRYTFDYTVPVDKEVRIAIEGTNRSTSLYVDGKLKQTLEIIPHPEDKHLDRPRFWVQTLVFPLAKLEPFEGTLRNLCVDYLGE